MKKLTKYLTGILFGTFLLGITAFAAEVEPVSAIGYTKSDTKIKTEDGKIFLTKEQCPDNIPLFITGVTDDYRWEVDLGQEQKYYISITELKPVMGNTKTVQTEKGTMIVADLPQEIPKVVFNRLFKYRPAEEYTETDFQNFQMAYAATVDALNIAMNAGDYERHYSDIPVDMTYVTYVISTGISELKYDHAYGEIDKYLEKLYPDYMFLTLRARKIDRNWFKQWTIKG